MPSLRQPAEVLTLPAQRNQNSAACRWPEPRQQRIGSLEMKADPILIPAIDPELAMHTDQFNATDKEPGLEVRPGRFGRCLCEGVRGM